MALLQQEKRNANYILHLSSIEILLSIENFSNSFNRRAHICMSLENIYSVIFAYKYFILITCRAVKIRINKIVKIICTLNDNMNIFGV